jgi:hypothetical protein
LRKKLLSRSSRSGTTLLPSQAGGIGGPRSRKRSGRRSWGAFRSVGHAGSGGERRYAPRNSSGAAGGQGGVSYQGTRSRRS